MKKILFAILLFVPIFLLSQSNIKAACVFRPADTCPTYPCDINGTSRCCATQQECTDNGGTNGGCVDHLSSCNNTLPCCATGDSCSNNNICEIPATPTSTPTPNPGSVTCTPTRGTAGTGISTAIGCIPMLGINGTTDFLTFILRWAVGIGSGIAFLLILYAGFMIMTSAGNPERLKAGQELLTSAISGLILLIFSVFILKFIGVDILGLGNFGFGVAH